MLKTPLLVASIVLSALLVAGCGDSKKPADGGNNASGGGGNTGGGGDAGGAAKTADVANGAVVKGVIKFDGTPPNDKPLGIDGEDFCKGKHPDGLKSEYYRVKDGKVANCLVYVKEGLSGKYAPVNPSPTIDQHGCQYLPHVLGVVAGQDIIIKNSDSIAHNIHALPKKSQEFNFAQTKAGEEAKKSFSSAEIVKIKCDIHGWMGCVVGVFNHPFFAVTGEDGSFEIKGLPAGKYKLEVWHEKFGTQTVDVEVKEKETKSVDFPALKSE